MPERSIFSTVTIIILLIVANLIIVCYTPFVADSVLKSSVRIMLNTALGYGLLVSIGRFWPIRALLALSVYSSVLLALTYQSNISLAVVFSLVGATPYESWDFMKSNYTSMIIAAVVALVLFMVKPGHHRLPNVIAGTFALLYICLPALIHPFIHPERFEIEQQEARAKGFSKPLEITQIALDNTPAFKSPSLEIIKASFDAISFSYSRQQSQIESSWSSVSSAKNNDLIVVSIGESLRANNMALYGYPRDTTPRLGALGNNLSVIKNVFSAGTNTWSSIPTTLTGLGDKADPSQSLINLAKDAGYKTFWISNQGQFSEWDFVVSALAKQSSADFFLSEEEGGEKYDNVVIEKFKALLNEPTQVDLTGKNLFVLHFYGSHPSFIDRYPVDETYFKTGNNPLIDQYDNSVRYGDKLQREIIDTISPLNGRYVFFADHGMGEPNGSMALKHDVRAVPNIESLRVPLLFYPSYEPPPELGSHLSLMKFLCVFAHWANIHADQINTQNCRGDNVINYFDVNMKLNQHRFE